MAMFGTQDGQLCAGNISGGKKGNALDVIPVCMAQEQVRLYRARLRQQRLPQSPDTSASIKNDERIVIEPHFDTGSIATVAHGGGSWCGDGSACPPEPDLHMLALPAPFPPAPQFRGPLEAPDYWPLAASPQPAVHCRRIRR